MLKRMKPRNGFALIVVVLVGLGAGLGVGIGIGAGIWKGKSTPVDVFEPQWFFVQQSNKARVVKNSQDSDSITVMLDGLSEKATAITAQPVFIGLTLPHDYLAALLTSDPGKNALLNCDRGDDKIALPFSIDSGSSVGDEAGYTGRLISFNNATWRHVDEGKMLNASSTLKAFGEGLEVEFESCNLFIDDFDFLKDQIKWAAGKYIDTMKTASDLNPMTAFLPSKIKDDAAQYLKEKAAERIDKVVGGTKESFEMDQRGIKNPCAFFGNVLAGDLGNPVLHTQGTKDVIQSQGLCTSAEEAAQFDRGAEGIDFLTGR